jgi:hypothetical protein
VATITVTVSDALGSKATGTTTVTAGSVPVVTPINFSVAAPTTSDELIGTITFTGGTPTSWAVVSGDPNKSFAIYLQSNGNAHLRTSDGTSAGGGGGPQPTANTTYALKVTATNASGVSTSASISVAVGIVVVDTTPPSVPTNLVWSVSGATANLSWTASTDNVKVTGYNVFRNGVKLGTTAVAFFVDTTFVSGTTYTVSAFDAAGNTSAQAMGTIITLTDLGFPGQPSNPVGFAAAPGYPGSLTTWPGGEPTGGTAGNPAVYSFYDFVGTGIDNSNVIGCSNAHIKFIGCRFQNSNVNSTIVFGPTGNDYTFSYCTFCPLVSLASAPPNPIWPTSGAGLGIGWGSGSYVSYLIPRVSGYSYAFLFLASTTVGPFTWDHCDFWGFGSAITWGQSTQQMNVTDCWFHDTRNDGSNPQGSGNGDHTDGIGFQAGGTPPFNVLVQHCTIAAIANNQGFAFQGATTPYNNLICNNNYVTGWSVQSPNGVTGGTNISFQNNTFGTDVPWSTAVSGDKSNEYIFANGQIWRNNKLHIRPGGVYWGGFNLPGGNHAWDPNQEGYYIWPDGGQSPTVTDYTG